MRLLALFFPLAILLPCTLAQSNPFTAACNMTGGPSAPCMYVGWNIGYGQDGQLYWFAFHESWYWSYPVNISPESDYYGLWCDTYQIGENGVITFGPNGETGCGKFVVTNCGIQWSVNAAQQGSCPTSAYDTSAALDVALAGPVYNVPHDVVNAATGPNSFCQFSRG